MVLDRARAMVCRDEEHRWVATAPRAREEATQRCVDVAIRRVHEGVVGSMHVGQAVRAGEHYE